MPMTMSLFAWAWEGAGAARPPARAMAVTMASICLMRFVPFLSYLSPRMARCGIVPGVPPQTVQALGLDNEKEDDEGAEQHEAEVGDEIEHRLGSEEETAERLHGVADHDGQQGDEGGPED